MSQQAPAVPGLGTLPRALNVLLMGAAGIIVIAGVRAFATSLSVVFLALTLIVVARPVQQAVHRRGLPPIVGVIALILTAFGTLVVVGASLVWASATLVGHLAGGAYDDQIQSYRDDLTTQLENLGYTGDNAQSLFDLLDVNAVAGQFISAVSGALGILSMISLLVISMLFMAVDTGRFTRILETSVAESRPNVVVALQNFASSTRSYFLVATVFGFIVAVLDVVALLILGVPLALVWGVLSFITNYIPNVGFVLGLIPPALLAFLDGGWQLSVVVIVVYAAINVVIQSVIQPKFVGDAVGLSMTATFLSLIFWGWVFGPLGALLAVPMTLLAKALLIDVDPGAAWLSPLISLDPSTATAATATATADADATATADGDADSGAPADTDTDGDAGLDEVGSLTTAAGEALDEVPVEPVPTASARPRSAPAEVAATLEDATEGG
ncbi:MAG: AI-2E family transporter [Actinomycetota bacterium]